MLSAALFELEGVLADLKVARRTGVLRALGTEGVVLSEAEYDATCHGLPVSAAVKAGLTLRGATSDHTAVDLLAHLAQQHSIELLANGVSLEPGAAELVDELHGTVRLALVSRVSRREADLIFSLSPIGDAFECMIFDEDAFLAKPSAVPYLAAFDRLDRRRAFQREHAVALEDGLPGIRSARAARIRCIAVGSVPAHVAMDADGFLPSLARHSASSLEALLAPRGELRP
jgi:beta-phosphoglucomutase-like phosphatase (HAD superfamily)